MPLYIKDRDVDAMASKLAERAHITKTEAVRRALATALTEAAGTPSLADLAVQRCRALKAKAGTQGLPADKDFRDSLYE